MFYLQFFNPHHISVHHLGKTILPTLFTGLFTSLFVICVLRFCFFCAPINVSPSSLGLLVCTSCRIMSSSRSSRTRRLLLFLFCTRNAGVFFSCAGSSETTTSEIACESPSAVTSYQGSDECQKCSRLINRNICCFFSFN